MKYTFFHIMALDSNKETERLNDFLLKNTINSIDREFVSDGGNSFWSICIVTHENSTSKMTGPNPSKNKQRVDYQEILSPEHFSRFTYLRELRNEIAQENNIVAYAVFTNEQIAEISQLELVNINTLSNIKGIGGKRLKIYGAKLIEKLDVNK